MELAYARTSSLNVAYIDRGPSDGPVALLLHGFPYDVHAYDDVTRRLTARGVRVIVPYLRGFGPTRFRGDSVMRSGEQAALGQDALDLMDAIGLDDVVIGGYDWGGRGGCVAAAVAPERFRGLVSSNGYNMHLDGDPTAPADPGDERRYWYQFYFHGERGRRALESNRAELCRLLWQTWSPTWTFTEDTFHRSATAFDNPDWVEVVVHSYRVRYGLVAGDPAHADLAARCAAGPEILVPSIVLDPADDDVQPQHRSGDPLAKFVGPAEYRLLAGVGHNVPQEAPDAFADAVLDLINGTVV